MSIRAHTFQPQLDRQTYTITTPNPLTSTTYEFILQASNHSTPGTAYLRLTALPNAVAVIHERGPHVNYADGNYTGPSNSVTHTYSVGDAAPWSYDSVSPGFYDSHSWQLVPSQTQTDSVDNLSGSWDMTISGTTTHTLTLSVLSGFDVISSAVLVVTVILNDPPVVAIISGGFGLSSLAKAAKGAGGLASDAASGLGSVAVVSKVLPPAPRLITLSMPLPVP